MKEFLMVCFVAAKFETYDKKKKFEVTAKDRGQFIMAPEWIKSTLLFKLLLKDGSIKVTLDKADQKKVENDPSIGINAEGKAQAVTETAETAGETAEEPKKARTTRKKGEK